MRSGIRDTGTTTSSLIFFGATVRRAGESALRVRHSRSTWASLTSKQPSWRAAAMTASLAASSAAALSSSSIMSRAPASAGTPGSE